MSYFLGIDGGGSQTRALLASEEGAILSYTIEGASNLNFSEEREVEKTLSSLLARTFKQIPVEQTHAYIGLAGASSETNQQLLQKILEKIGLRLFTITTDAEIALQNALSHGANILLISGTGSVCLGKKESGDTVRTGGWGALIDDAGSGSWIGTQALALAIRQRDGRRDSTELQHTIWEKLDVNADRSIVDRIYNPMISRSDLASLAPAVIDLALQGDTDAQRIIDDAVHELAALVKATALKIDLAKPRVALHGGILENSSHIRSKLKAALPSLQISPLETPPVLTAVKMAYQECHGANKDWESELKSSYRAFSAGETELL